MNSAKSVNLKYYMRVCFELGDILAHFVIQVTSHFVCHMYVLMGTRNGDVREMESQGLANLLMVIH